MKSAKLLFFTSLLAFATLSHAQVNQEGFDDYGAFQTDPIDLDNEYQDTFGRFFQLNFHLGTSILTGGLGASHSAGVMFGGRFIFFFDKMLAAELGASFSSQSGLYNEDNTKAPGLEIDETMKLTPITLGLRYAFDPESLPRGFAAMNPYLVATAELIFRSESIKSATTTGSGLDPAVTSKYSTGAVVNTRGYGPAIGGGFEFDVYRKKMYLGLDLRYHMIFWSDGGTFIGTASRKGNYISVLGTASYNY